MGLTRASGFLLRRLHRTSLLLITKDAPQDNICRMPIDSPTPKLLNPLCEVCIGL